MPTTQPRSYENDLQPVQITQTTLQQALKDLQQAVLQGTKVLQKNSRPPLDPAEYGSIYSGNTGIGLAFLRLEQQKKVLTKEGQDASRLPDFAKLADERIPPVSTSDMRVPKPGRMSPIGSSLGPVVVRILTSCENSKQLASRDDVNLLHTAVQHSLTHGHAVSLGDEIRGVDEVLYGRAGLLWALLSIRSHAASEEAQRAVKPVVDGVPRLLDVMLDAGRRGARDFTRMHGEKDAFPLMWPYKDERFSLGSVHGIAGILTVILSCGTEEVDTYLPFITDTITDLCHIAIKHGGHLPSSIPSRSSSRSSYLVQICHGAPGLVVLLATARNHNKIRTTFWRPEWDEAIRLGTERVWQEGLLTKGGSLCHGLTGNALSLLMLYDSLETDSSSGDAGNDYFLSRALTLLLLARESPPYSTALKIRSSYDFRMPDRPYNLYEGLAGELCAWAEACVVIQGKLSRLGIGEKGKQYEGRRLGFPCLGGSA